MSILNEISTSISEIFETASEGVIDVGSQGQQLNPLPKVDEIGLYHDKKENPAAETLWNGIIKESTARINTVLEERSYLDFYFPNSLIGRRRVVFFENPKITEQRTPRYARKVVMGRNEPVRMWIGADARKVKVSFTYTLPHVEMFFKMMGHLPAGFANAASSQTSQLAKTLQGIDSSPKDAGNQIDWRRFTAETVDKFFGTSFSVDTAGGTLKLENPSKKGPRMYTEGKGLRGVDGFEVEKTPKASFIEGLIGAWSTKPTALDNSDMVATFYTQFVIDTLRASVVGDTLDSGNMAVGPPIVRFRHGTVFNEAPFIVTDMSVDYSTEAGVEVRTLLPRQVKFTLSLEEFRQTHGAQHGEGKEAVQNAANIIDLNLDFDSANVNRSQYPKHTF